MATEGSRSSSFFANHLFSGIKTRRSVYTIEESEQESFGVVSALLGPEFALRAEGSPHLLQKSQRLLDGFFAQVERYVSSLTDKLHFAVSLGKGLQYARFCAKVDTPAQLLLSRSTIQTLRSDLRAERYRQREEHPALYFVAPMRETLQTAEAQNALQSILSASKGDASRMVPILESFAFILVDDDLFSGDANLKALIGHPALVTAFAALTSSDNSITNAAVAAIQAAVNVSSSAGETAALEGAWELATFLFKQASDLAPKMKDYVAMAAKGDFSEHNQAAALAKVLASVTAANIIPVSGLLADKEARPLLQAMAAIRSYPAPDVRSEGALFWRILRESDEMAMAWAQDLRLNEASCLVGLIQRSYIDLVYKLYNSAVLPESTWDHFSAGQQAMLLQQRKAIAESLVEAVGVLGFQTCMDELWEAFKGCKGQWSPQEALLACANMLHRASPPLAQCKLVYMFERLSYLPRVGALTATAIESIVLYGPWVTATAAVAPAEADNMLDQFNYFWHTEEAMAYRSRVQQAQKAPSEASEELRSEETSAYDSSESQAPEHTASDADDSDAEGCYEAERVTFTALSDPPTQPPQQPAPGAANSSVPSRAPRGPPPGFPRRSTQVTPTPVSDTLPTPPPQQPVPRADTCSGRSRAPRGPPPGFACRPPTQLPQQPAPMGASESMPSRAPRGPPPGFTRPSPEVPSVTPAATTMSPTEPPQPASIGANKRMPGRAPGGAPPGFKRPAPQVTPTATVMPTQPPSQPAQTGLDCNAPSRAPRRAPPGFQRPAPEVAPADRPESLPSRTDSSAAASTPGAVPDSTSQSAPQAEAESGLHADSTQAEQAEPDTVSQDGSAQVEPVAPALNTTLPGGSLPSAVPHSTAQSASGAESDFLSGEQAEHGASQQEAPVEEDPVPEEESVAPAPTTALSGTFIGKMFYAAGALVGTVQGCARLFR
ncbi:g11011 [Coccomyxa viridis]|uniref:G11011 protein n=1 Tax=Coccomyxa viridis TaxID=1274662 RepID=A0ABP1GCR4_9CHLO